MNQQIRNRNRMSQVVWIILTKTRSQRRRMVKKMHHVMSMYEQGVSQARLRQYVQRWVRWSLCV